MMARELLTKRDKRKIGDNGYMYTYERSNGEGSKLYWRCDQRSSEFCRARLHTDSTGTQILHRVNDHNHGSDPAVLEVTAITVAIKRRAAATQEMPGQILNQEIQNTCDATLARMPSRDAVRKIIKRKRRKIGGVPLAPIDLLSLVQVDAMESRPPLPPFDFESATLKVRLAEDAWNSRDPKTVATAYTLDTQWRNRVEFINGREEVEAFLERKWNKELEYRLIKELWAYHGSRIAVRFAYEWRDDSGNWFRSYGNENWQFNDDGLMTNRLACINDLPIDECDRKYRWPLGRRPDDHPGLGDLGL